MPTPISACLPLLAYTETLSANARVLLVGSATSRVPEALVERGARLVYVCDRDPARRAEAQARTADRTISFGSLEDGPAALREGFFDFALIENLGAETDPDAVLRSVNKLLAPRGVVLVVAPNPEAKRPLIAFAVPEHRLDYYTLYDRVSSHFASVRMLGQVPFVAYAVVDFSAEGDPSPVLDTSLAPARGEEPDYFLALASQQSRALDEYAVVQLEAASLEPRHETQPPLEPAVASNKAEVLELQRQLAEQEKWILELEGRSTAADERADSAEGELEELRARVAELEQVESELDAQRQRMTELERAKLELDAQRQRMAELERAKLELDAQRQRMTELERAKLELDAQRQRMAELERSAQSQGALEAVRKRLAELEQARGQERATFARERAELETERDTLRQRTSELDDLVVLKNAELAATQADTQTEQDLARLEQQLKERGSQISKLERDLLEAQRTGRELIRKLCDLTPPEATQHLAERLVEAEAELVTLRWSLDLVGARSLGAHSPAS